VKIVFLIYINVSEIVWCNIVSDCIILHWHQNVYKLPASWFYCCYESVALALSFLCCLHFHPLILPYFFIFPNALLISVHFNPSHSDLYQIYSLVGWVVKWSGDTGEFYGYRWQLSPHALQSSRLLWNMKHSDSGFAFHFNLLPLAEWMYMLGFFNLSSINYFYVILGIINVIILISCSPYHFGSIEYKLE